MIKIKLKICAKKEEGGERERERERFTLFSIISLNSL